MPTAMEMKANSFLSSEFELPKGNYRVVFLVHVGTIAALFCEQSYHELEQLVCEYRLGKLKWRLVNYKSYSDISRIARPEEYKQLYQSLEEAGYKVTSVLSCQIT